VSSDAAGVRHPPVAPVRCPRGSRASPEPTAIQTKLRSKRSVKQVAVAPAWTEQATTTGDAHGLQTGGGG